jgi:hypothetical protein
MLVAMVKPISLRIHHAEVTARARQLLRRLDAEAAARLRFKLFATKGFLALSEMRSALEQLPPGDRDQWQGEIKRIEATLLKISRSSR